LVGQYMKLRNARVSMQKDVLNILPSKW